MKIFIGSSSKKKNKARKIARYLELAGFTVFCWWDSKVFKSGVVTIDRLIEMSDICDGAVFVFGKDDEVTKTKNGKVISIATPIDNVILEYGIFVSKFGRRRTLFVTEDGVEVPSDLNGVTYLNKRNYADQVVHDLKDVLQQIRITEYSGQITVHLNRKLLNLLATGGNPNWASRSLYIGSRGASAWKEVENCSGYSGKQDFNPVQHLIQRLIRDAKIDRFDCVISFGPGLGHLDKAVVPYLCGNELLRYIPVDINYYLANYAAENLDDSAKHIHVPFCIIGDFEDGMSRIAETIDDFTSPGRAFIMLGGTFGNLENGEDAFLKGLCDCMHNDDIAVIDIFTAKGNYEFTQDPLFPLDNIKSSAVKRFLAGGARPNNPTSIEKIAENISKYLGIRLLIEDRSSHIPETKAFEIYCRTTDRSVIYVRRYNYEQFLEHLKKLGFKVLSSGSVPDDGTITGRSVVILKKK